MLNLDAMNLGIRYVDKRLYMVQLIKQIENFI